MNTFGYVGSTITLLAGLLGLCFPVPVARTIGLTLNGKLGLSEFRATYGGLFLAAGGAALLIRSHDAVSVLAAAWTGAAASRSISAVFDRSWSKENVAGIVIELAVASLLFAGAV